MMINNLKKIALGIFILSVFSIFGQAEAYTKTKTNIPPSNDFVVEPGKTEIFLNPGESVIKNITVTNRVDKTVKFKLSTEDMTGTDNPLSPIKLLGDETGPYSLKNFIEPEINEFSLDLGEKITIPVKISIPSDAEPRGYYGALIVSNEPDVIEQDKTNSAEGQTRLISRIGSLFLLRINGEGKESGNLEDFRIIGPSKLFYDKKPSGFEIAFRNTGNVHLVPHGKIIIKNMFGKIVAELPVDAYFALPDSLRYREVLWGGGIGLGRYTASLSLYKGYGSESDNATSKIAFWIIPWKILIITFIGLIILISLIYYFLTRFELKRK